MTRRWKMARPAGTVSWDMNAVATLAAARDLRRVAVVLRATSITGVETKALAVLDDRAVFEIVSRLTHCGSKLRLVQLEVLSLFLPDQEPIHEQLAS